jgi:DtxR family Mn-dependent transcriptional regulator
VKLQESGENYLETILMIQQEKGTVRSIDVARQLDFSKPSISRAMTVLRENGYILMDKSGLITLTELGYEVASQIYERHRLLTQWLIALGVTPAVAAADACRMEHDVSEETFQKLKEHIGVPGERE